MVDYGFVLLICLVMGIDVCVLLFVVYFVGGIVWNYCDLVCSLDLICDVFGL